LPFGEQSEKVGFHENDHAKPLRESEGHISRQLGAGGGGAPHLAFGGGKDASRLAEALGSVKAWLSEKIK
jgi:alanyl-tRNA synthetase